MKLLPRLKPFFNYKESFALLNPFNKKGAIEKFEQAFAQQFENKFGTFFAHGRTGIFALLKVWNLEEAEIICPAYTCVVVPNAIVLSRNVPVFVDSKNDDWNMDLDLLEKSIGPKTRVIIATHLFGYPMNVKALEDIVNKAEKRYNQKIYVIQDVAHSYAAKWDGESVTRYGDAAIFGMNISKILSSIFGGMVICNDAQLNAALKKWRKENCIGNRGIKSVKRMLYYFAVRVAFNTRIYGLINFLERKGLLDSFVKYYDEESIEFPKDWNSKPTHSEAVVGLLQIEKYETAIKQRRKKAYDWKNKFGNDESIRFFNDHSGCTFSHCVALVKNREEWVEKFRKEAIQLGILIEYSVPEMKAYQKYKRTEYPNAKYFAEHTINFPNWPG